MLDCKGWVSSLVWSNPKGVRDEGSHAGVDEVSVGIGVVPPIAIVTQELGCRKLVSLLVEESCMLKKEVRDICILVIYD